MPTRPTLLLATCLAFAPAAFAGSDDTYSIEWMLYKEDAPVYSGDIQITRPQPLYELRGRRPYVKYRRPKGGGWYRYPCKTIHTAAGQKIFKCPQAEYVQRVPKQP